MKHTRLALVFLAASAVTFCSAQTPQPRPLPVYLPATSFWAKAIPSDQRNSGIADLDEAYRLYVAGDMLSARTHLYKARTLLNRADLRLRALSLACLLDMGSVSDTFLILWKPPSSAHGREKQTAASELLSERWKSEGVPSDGSFQPWIDLFSGYQEYQRGERTAAGLAWQNLAGQASDPYLQGLALLGVVQVAGQYLAEAISSKQTPTDPPEKILQVASMAEKAFTEVPLPFGVAQAHLLSAQVAYLGGNWNLGWSQLDAANKIFLSSRGGGWTDTELIAIIGENRKGNTAASQDALLAIEAKAGDHRVPPERVKTLVGFTRKLPQIVGLDDSRSVQAKMAAAREFYGWASATHDPLLELISLRTLSDLLREAGYLSDASFFSTVSKDLWDRYRSGVPFSMRLRRAAFLDYDFLRESKFLESHDPVSFSMVQIAELCVSAKKLSITDEELQIANVSRSELNGRIDHAYAPLLEQARNGDAALAEFRSRMQANDGEGARKALTALVTAWDNMLRLLNLFTPGVHRTGELTANRKVLSGGRMFEIHTKVTLDVSADYRLKTLMDLRCDQNYLLLMNQLMAAALTGKDGYVFGGLDAVNTFYDKYRNEASPPDLLDIPFMLSGRGGFTGFDLPTAEKQRQKWLDSGITQIAYDSIPSLEREALADNPAGPEESKESRKKPDEEAARQFFERNYQPDGSGVRVTAHQIKRSEEASVYDPVAKLQTIPKTIITIDHAYKVSYEFKKDSEYRLGPAGSDGTDIEQRAALARQYWFDPPFNLDWPYPATPPRLDRILQQLHSENLGETLMQEQLGTTPGALVENLGRSPLIDAGQIALSAQSGGDFVPRSGTHDFNYWRKVFQDDAAAHQLISALAAIDPDSAKTDQLADIREQVNAALEKIIADDTGTPADSSQLARPLQPLFHIVGIAQILQHRPVLLLLMGNQSGAAEAAGTLSAKHATASAVPGRVAGAAPAAPAASDSGDGIESFVRDALSLALYDLATGQYPDAVKQLKPIPNLLRTKDPLRLFQVDYLLAMACRRGRDTTGEVESLRAAAEDLDRLRATLSTRNQASGLDAVRQFIYEELIGTLMSQKRYGEIYAALNRYKRSTRVPVSVMLAASRPDPELDALLRQVVYAYDVLSREEVWRVPDAGLIAQLHEMPDQPSGPNSAQEMDPRDFAALSLNHIADVLVDDIRIASEASSRSDFWNAPLRPDGLTVSYFMGTRGLYRVAIGASGAADARFLAKPEPEISKDCDRFRAAIQEGKDPIEAVPQLYETLLGALPELVSHRRLYISPDGPLNFIPFQALRRDQKTPYLIEDHSISYLAGATAGRGNHDAAGRALLVGNPDGSLAAAQSEVESIAQISELRPLDPLIGGAATLENVGKRLSDAGLVHFATHAHANQSYPNFAYLQLGAGDRLYSLNLGGLRFSGKDVFLSACETRLGQITPGEDIYGLADAFLSAGASSVVSTLWRIESESSALFARRYYELFTKTHDAPEALATTAREFIQKKWFVQANGATNVLDAPLFWAGFNHLVPSAGVE